MTMQSFDQFHADAEKRQAEFFGQFQKTATTVAKRGLMVWAGVIVLNAILALAMFAGAVFIVLGSLRYFGVI